MILTEIIPNIEEKNLQEIDDSLKKLSSIDNLFEAFFYGEGDDYELLCVSRSIEKVTGYPVEKFLSASGIRFFYSITPEKYLPHIIERGAFYRKQARTPGFDVDQAHIMEFDAGLIHKNGSELKIRNLGVVLEYTVSHDFHLILGTWQDVRFLNESEMDAYKEKIEEILIDVKHSYVRNHPVKLSNSVCVDNNDIKVFYPLYKGPKVTKREYKVLQLIANGLSSKEIADQLFISFHTAESHRKHLLEKFEAKNVAELIKKASKMFWFE